MTKFVGRRGVLGLARETTRGTAVSPSIWVPYAGMSFFDRIEQAREEQGQGKIADSDSAYVTMQFGEGELESQLYDKALGLILTSLMGAAPSTAGSDPYTHTFTLSNTNQPASLSLYWEDPDRNYLFPLSVVDSFQMVVEPSGIVQYTVGFKSKRARQWTAQTENFTSLGNKFLHQHLEFRLAANVGALAAASKLSLKRLELNINRNANHDPVIGTVEPEDILSNQFSVSGSLQLNLEDDTYRNYMLDGTYRAMEVLLNRSAGSSLKFQFPRMDFSEWEPDYTLNQIATQTIQFKGNYDQANGLDIISTCELVNSQVSY